MKHIKSHYEQLGGETAVRKLVDRFYDLMDESEQTQALRQLHPKSLRMSRQKLFMFLSGWLGGPTLYVEKYGHPRLRARHLPFPIGTSERDQWLYCMYKALDEQVEDSMLCMNLKHSFAKTADHMRNRTG